MVCGAVMFGPVVVEIGFAGLPVEPELILCFTVPQPMEPHVHGFGAPWLNVGVYNPECSAVVSLHGGWRLWVSHFVEDVVSGHKSGTVLCTVGYIKRGKGTPGMFDPVL